MTKLEDRTPKNPDSDFTFDYNTERTSCCDAYYTFSGDGMAMCRWCFSEVQGRLS